MGWQDRPYYRDRSPGSGNPFMWLMTGTVSIGTWFGIHVDIHASLIAYIVITLLLPGSIGGMQNAATSSAILFITVLLHEFGHCFASRSVGGNPTHIIMHPLGGLAFSECPPRPWPTFVTVAGGPLVNVVICAITAVILALMAGTWTVVPWLPMNIHLLQLVWSSQLAYYLWWIFLVSYSLLLFNLLPIFPLDGGRLLQSILWAKFGYYKATYFAAVTGMIGAVLVGLYGLAHFSILLMFLAFWGFQTCLMMYRELKANGPWAYQDREDYSAAYIQQPVRSKKVSARKIKAAQREEQEVAKEQEQIDVILDKVHKQGMQSLTWLEKRALHKATERQRERGGAPRR